MQNVTVTSSKLLEILHENRGTHASEYKAAEAAYRKLIIKDLEDKLTTIRQGGKIDLTFSHPCPQSHENQYNRAIRMLELSTEHTVTLSSTEFDQYVQDDWSWSAVAKYANTYCISGAASL